MIMHDYELNNFFTLLKLEKNINKKDLEKNIALKSLYNFFIQANVYNCEENKNHFMIRYKSLKNIITFPNKCIKLSRSKNQFTIIKKKLKYEHYTKKYTHIFKLLIQPLMYFNTDTTC